VRGSVDKAGASVEVVVVAGSAVVVVVATSLNIDAGNARLPSGRYEQPASPPISNPPKNTTTPTFRATARPAVIIPLPL
jgi:hypothetical protein